MHALHKRRPLLIWLAVVYLMVFLMVLVGGITRLTGSGLSIVEWQPLMGTFPPLNEAQWQEVFGQYQQSPQYQQVNADMSLDSFKFIFFWEYIHRLLGRLIGLVVFLPWIYFWMKKMMDRRTSGRTFFALILGGLQGILGWYMVKSGLVDVPAVSHVRLAAHLMLALLVAQWILWIFLDLIFEREKKESASLRIPGVAWFFLGLVGLQCVYGAFMAGTKAGWMFPTFPTMNGQWVPAAMGSPVSDPTAIHFIHRILGYGVVLSGWGLAVILLWQSRNAWTRMTAWALVVVLGIQFFLGVLTVVLHVPLAVAVAHQGGAAVLLSVAVCVIYFQSPRKVRGGVFSGLMGGAGGGWSRFGS